MLRNSGRRPFGSELNTSKRARSVSVVVPAWRAATMSSAAAMPTRTQSESRRRWASSDPAPNVLRRHRSTNRDRRTAVAVGCMVSRCHTGTGTKHRQRGAPPYGGRTRRPIFSTVTRTGVDLPPVVTLDPLFDARGAADMVALCRRFGRYRMYAEHEQLDAPL